MINIERKRPYEPDRIRVERGDWIRADGNCICPVCNLKYYAHSPVFGYEYLHRICDGLLVKL